MQFWKIENETGRFTTDEKITLILSYSKFIKSASNAIKVTVANLLICSRHMQSKLPPKNLNFYYNLYRFGVDMPSGGYAAI